MISRRILVAVALLCAVSAPSYAQKTKAMLNTEISVNFPDNTVGFITPSELRNTTLDIVNSIMPAAPVVAGNLACFSGTTGLLQDCGSSPLSLVISAANVTYTAPYSNAVSETQSAYNSQRVSINDFGGVGDGSTNNDSAFLHAMAQTPPIAVDIPCGTYNVTQIIITQPTALIGRGSCSVIRSTTANLSVIHVNASLLGVTIRDLTIDRTTTATSGGDGIDFSLISDQGRLSNIYFKNQFNGLDIGNTGFSFANNLSLIGNVNNGLNATNGAAGAAGVQWQLDNIVAQANGLNGFLFTCNGTGSMSLGQHKGLASFSNGAKGLVYQGSSTCPINGVRLIDSFFGADGNAEVLLDTFGAFPHTLTHVTMEASTASAPCLSVTVNNPAVSVVNSTANACAGNGITSAGPTLGVIGGNYSNNVGIGISVTGASTIRIVGAKIGGSPQTNGITLAAAAINGVVADNDVSGTGGNITNSSSGTTLRINDNTGYNPVGLTAGTSTGTSASTITAGPSPETHYITQSANFNAVIKSGATSLCTVPSATVPCVIQLGPNEAYTVTWTTTQPTYSKFVH